MHTLLLEDYGISKKWVIIMDRRQDSNAALNPEETSGPSPQDRLCQELRRRREETAWKRSRIKTSLVVVMFMLRVMTYVVSDELFF